MVLPIHVWNIISDQLKVNGGTWCGALFIGIFFIAIQNEKPVRGRAVVTGFSTRATTAAAALIRLLETAVKLSNCENHGQDNDQGYNDILPHSNLLSKAHQRSELENRRRQGKRKQGVENNRKHAPLPGSAFSRNTDHGNETGRVKHDK